jgi:outer membrane immunogenic protein
MFMPNWSAKVEYLYTDVSGGNSGWGNNLGVSLNSVNNHTRWNTVRAGVNYHFNWGAAPVVAKY